MKKIIYIMVAMTAFLFASWQEDLKKASLEYAQNKKNELVAQGNKKAIFALYKKIYPNLNTKNEKEALKTLATVGVNVTKINDIASKLASGDETKVREATETLGVEFGKQLNSVVKDPYLKGKMDKLLGSVDEIKNISKILGEASAGDSKALYEYAATAFINAAGGGGVMSFYTTAHGVMKYAKDSYMESTVEELYQKYKEGKLSQEDFDLQTDLGGYHTVIRDKMIEERKKKLESLGNVEVSDELLKHLTNVSEEDIKKEMFASFQGRKKKETDELSMQDKIKANEAQGKEILDELIDAASKKYNQSDKDELLNRVDFGAYINAIERFTRNNPHLDVKNSVDVKKMAQLISAKFVFGANSKEYQEAFKSFKEYLKATRNIDIEEEESVAFVGTIKGSWNAASTGGNKFKAKGSFELSISASGAVSGKYWGDDSGSLSGTINASGNMNIKSGGGSAGGARWSGSIVRDNHGNLAGSGTFASKGWSGSWRGSGR
ncbi:MAG: hypothetical protein JXQ76_10785 [Campylobacterales bacterium]|nr:hypothetical protein [Campylobacterales bacterium]